MDISNTNLSSAGWNWELKTDDEGPQLIAPGTYPARISWLEQGDFLGRAKMPPCPKAVLTLMIDTGEGAQELKTTLLVHPRMEWKLSEFFRSIGRKRHGEPLKMDWEGLVGLPLLVRVNHRSYIDSSGEQRTVNNIERFLDYNPDAFPKDPDWLASAMAGESDVDEEF